VKRIISINFTKRKIALVAAAAMFSKFSANAPMVQAKDYRTTSRGTDPMIYVTSQGLVHDSIVLGDLPNEGPFQLPEVGGPIGLMTEFGPGDKGHVGDRWWIDVNGDGEMDDGYKYFICPCWVRASKSPDQSIGRQFIAEAES